ncbi:MobF family relaxase, partial [Hafnia paralvei]
MMSFSQVKSAGGAAGYYTDKDNYYVLGSMDDRWHGEGAKLLGLAGSIDKDTFTRALKGLLPDGSDLSRLQDGSNKHRPGYDLTFSAPKSVSVMAMLGGDKRLIEAHNRAVDVALKQVEALASTRVMRDGVSETVLTGNLVIARFNHDTSRDQDPQLHTHSVVLNATRNEDKWQALSSDTVGKTGFSENVLANQIALGKIYNLSLRREVEAMGYEVDVVGKHGLWEMRDVPVAPFSSRRNTIVETVGADASRRSRDVAALDTRKSKEVLEPAQKMAEWLTTLKTTGFDMEAYRKLADTRVQDGLTPAPLAQEPADVGLAVTQAISLLSERKTQFTYADVLAKTVGQLPALDGVIQQAREGIDEAIARQQLIPLDKEKGIFTSDVHVLDELSIDALSKEVMRQGHVHVSPNSKIDRPAPYSDAVSVLAQDKPPMAILS